MQKNKSLRWKREEIFHDGDSFFSQLEKGLDLAQKTISLETYIFANDTLGKRIATALKKAAARDVEVRVLVDGFGSPGWELAFRQDLRDAGVQAYVHNPLPKSFKTKKALRETGSVLLNLFSKLNRRNHRKTCIVDSRILWIGSMNISDNHLASRMGNSCWRDTSARLEGRGIAEVERAFGKAWKKAVALEAGIRLPQLGLLKTRAKRSGLVRLNHTWLLRRRLYDDLLLQIQQAEKTIWITNAYFLPPQLIITALCKAAAKGVDVRILISKDYDVFFFGWVSSLFNFSLLQAGVKIFEYTPSILHAKILIIDDTIMLGSSNFNHRSFIHDLEADIYLTHESSKRDLTEQFAKDLEKSHQLTLETCVPITQTDLVSTLQVQPHKWDLKTGLEGWAGKLLFHLRYWL